MGLQKQMPGAHLPCIVCYLKATLWFVSRACFRSLELRYTRKVTRFLGVLENLEKYIFSMLTIFFSYYFHTSGFNPWKPAGTYFSNLFCKAFWIKWFRPKPYESIKWPVLISAFPTPLVSVCICWDWCWRFVGVSEVIVRKADLVTLVYCSLVCVVEDLQFPDLYRPQLPLLVSSLKRAALPLQKIHKLSRVLVLFVWSISSMHEIWQHTWRHIHKLTNIMGMYKHLTSAKRWRDSCVTFRQY